MHIADQHCGIYKSEKKKMIQIDINQGLIGAKLVHKNNGILCGH